MKRTMVLCDTCKRELAEEYSKELEQFIMIDSQRESNIWIGPVNKWTPSILLDDDKYFCDWSCFRVWIADWYRETQTAKENNDVLD